MRVGVTASGPRDGPVLLDVKLQPPPDRPGQIARNGAAARIDAALGARLILLAAPAGWGKTTALADWQRRAQPGMDVAWVALDALDDDPVQFWSYVAEALARVSAPIPLRTPVAAGVVPEESISRLLNGLAARRRPLTLVLDDFQVITNSRIHAQMTWFLEHAPAGVRVVIATRTEPPLPLARLRARGELVELRSADLGFARDEAGALLNGRLALGLGHEALDRLWRRTEGWAAALYLAGLSLASRDDREGFVDDFSGDDRNLVDYLGGEVIAALRPELRTFLRRTSILARLSAPLCDAVLDVSGSRGALAELERSNLFITPLDSHRGAYRYHQLFRETLARELRETEPHLEPGLHRRASAWYRQAGDVPSAVTHALAAGDDADAAALVATAWLHHSNHGRVHTVATWLDALPEQLLHGDPRLGLAAAWTALTLGRLGSVEGWLRSAERSPGPAPALPGATSIAGSAAIARSHLHRLRGDLGAAVRWGRRAASIEHADGPGRARAHDALGAALYWSGSPDAAVHLDEAMQVAGAHDQQLVLFHARSHLAAWRADRADPAAPQEAADALADATTHCLADMPPAALARMVLGDAAAAGGRTADAEDELTCAVRLARGGGPILIGAASVALARFRRERGEERDARALLREARAVLGPCVDAGSAIRRLLEEEDRLRPERNARTAAGLPLREPLTSREQDVLDLLPSLLTVREIGERLHLSRNTVKTHLRGLYRKLGVSGRPDAVRRAAELDLRPTGDHPRPRPTPGAPTRSPAGSPPPPT
ncbi:MAG: LuxR C-terminal-related transcriptional regulator [Thermoleophilia bacterium]